MPLRTLSPLSLAFACLRAAVAWAVGGCVLIATPLAAVLNLGADSWAFDPPYFPLLIGTGAAAGTCGLVLALCQGTPSPFVAGRWPGSLIVATVYPIAVVGALLSWNSGAVFFEGSNMTIRLLVPGVLVAAAATLPAVCAHRRNPGTAFLWCGMMWAVPALLLLPIYTCSG